MVLLYFIQTRNELEKHWNNKINFTVILYDNIPFAYKELLKKKLKENDFNCIDTADLTNEDLNCGKYLMADNSHPTEAAWDLLIPEIAKRLN